MKWILIVDDVQNLKKIAILITRLWITCGRCGELSGDGFLKISPATIDFYYLKEVLLLQINELF
jgi:hypothetical protein